MIKPEVIEKIREESDIVELIGSYIPLKRVGKYYRALCPFHTERSPSFYVNPERQSYHCFGCGVGGSAISFVMAYEKVDFVEAVRILGKRLGVKVEDSGPSRNRVLYEVCEEAARFFQESLGKSESAQAYLKKRGLEWATVKRFRLGFAPTGNLFRGIAKRKGFSDESLLQAGVVIKKGEGLVDYFRERIIFPIFSLSGKVIGFSGRVLDDSEPKYLNSPDTPIFRKGEILYGIFQAKSYIREEVPILVEGNFDLLTLANQGIKNVIAPLGTAFTPNQALLLRHYNRQVVLCYDGDEAGVKACRRALEVFLQVGIDPQIMKLPSGWDPDSFIRKSGREQFLILMEQGVDFIDFLLGEKKFKSIAEKRAVLDELTKLVRMIADETSRELYANKIAEIFQLDRARFLKKFQCVGFNSDAQIIGKRELGSNMNGGLAEKLVAVAVHNQILAQIVKEYRLSETIEDELLKKIVQLIESRCEDENFSPAYLIDLVDDEIVRGRIAQWTFTETTLPSKEEFRNRVRRFRARWLQKRIEACQRNGNEKGVEMLTKERERLLREQIKQMI